jgi:hypothetical protein
MVFPTCLVLLEVLHALLAVPTELVAGPGVVAAGAHFIGSTAGWDLVPGRSGIKTYGMSMNIHYMGYYPFIIYYTVKNDHS